MKRPQRFAWVAALLGVTIGLDQLTKQMATSSLSKGPTHTYLWDTFRLTYAENQGAFLSLGASLSTSARFWILTVSVGLLLLGLVWFALFGKDLDGWQVAGYAVIAGGGISNWIDRATREGLVVDFMNMGIGSLRTGVFNVADVAILAGIGILLLANRRREKTGDAAVATNAKG